jgi:hypothetical protein
VLVMAGKNVIASCLGLNTVLDPFQPQAREDGKKYLAKAINVRITDSSVIERSEFPRTLLTLTGGHSLFCDGGACLVHQGGAMYEVAADLTLSAAKRSSMSGDKISHTQAGDAIYFSNLSENGVYYGGLALSWAVDAYVGPETNRYFVDHVPFFSKIAYFDGYMLGAIGNALYASELGSLGLWEMKPVWMSNSTIIMVKPVVTDTFPPSGGVYVSDGSKISYLGGLEPRKFAEPRTTNYPALEWAVAHGLIDGALFGERSGLCAVFQTTKGLCLGYPDGTLVNVMQKAIKIPAGFTSGACLIDDHNIISTLR